MLPHEVLGVPLGASADVVRTAYKRAALESHPDKGGTKEAFQRVVLAFEQLSGVGNDSWQQKKPPEQPVAKRQAKRPRSKETPHGKHKRASQPMAPESSSQGGTSSQPNLPVRNFPEELRRLLQLLDARRRRQVLEEKLAPWQTVALQAWMLDRRKASEGSSSKNCSHITAVQDQVEVAAPSASPSNSAPHVGRQSSAAFAHPDAPDHRGRAGSGSRYPSQGGQRGVRTHLSNRCTTYAAFVGIRHVELRSLRQRDLAQAIADNIVLVAIKKKVQDADAGDLYRETLPKAIVDATQEHGFDHMRLRVSFRFRVRGTKLWLPLAGAGWQVSLPIGADLVDALPPNWTRRGVSPRHEEACWMDFKNKYRQVCANLHSTAGGERHLERVEAKFCRFKPKLEKKWLNSMRLRIPKKSRKQKRSSLEVHLSRVAQLIRSWQSSHDLETRKRKRDKEKALRDAARQRVQAAKEAKKKMVEKQMEARQKLAAARQRSAELMQRLRAERGMTMQDILHRRDSAATE